MSRTLYGSTLYACQRRIATYWQPLVDAGARRERFAPFQLPDGSYVVGQYDNPEDEAPTYLHDNVGRSIRAEDVEGPPRTHRTGNIRVMKYRVTWDNGASACGTFPDVFDTEEDAEMFGRDWALESNIRDFGEEEPEDGYTYEVIEVPDDGDPDAHEGVEHQRMRQKEKP